MWEGWRPRASRGILLKMRRRRRIILGLLLAICVASLWLGCSAERFILPANHEVIDPGSATRKLIQVDGHVVECWIKRCAAASTHEPEAFVLFFVGKGDRADRWIGNVAQAWNKHPAELWGVNYPGSGGSEGPPKLARVGPEALGAFDALKQIAGSRPVFIQAGSFGTAPALCVAARRPVAGLLLQNPVPLRQLILGQYGWWNLWLLAGPVAAKIPADLDSPVNAARASAPAIFISASADEVIPPKYHRLVIKAYAGPKRVIGVPGARHNDPLPREAAQQLAADLDWLWSSAAARGGSP